MNFVCPFCQFSLPSEFYVCPNCQKKIKDPPLSTTTGKQLAIYAISILLPPLGLWPGIKYLRDDDPKAKKIGLAAIVLTVVSFVVSTWISIAVLGTVNKMYTSQIKQYQNLGF